MQKSLLSELFSQQGQMRISYLLIKNDYFLLKMMFM